MRWSVLHRRLGFVALFSIKVLFWLLEFCFLSFICKKEKTFLHNTKMKSLIATSAHISTKYTLTSSLLKVLLYTQTHPWGLWCAGNEGPSEDLLVSCSVCSRAGVTPLAVGWLSGVERSARSGWWTGWLRKWCCLGDRHQGNERGQHQDTPPRCFWRWSGTCIALDTRGRHGNRRRASPRARAWARNSSSRASKVEVQIIFCF